MTTDELQSRLCDAVEKGYIETDVLDNQNDNLVPARSAMADSRAALSSLLGGASSRSEVQKSLTQLLAGSLPGVCSPEKDFPFHAVFSYDGGMEMSFFGAWGVLPSGDSTCAVLRPLKEKCMESGKASPVVLGGLPFWLLPKGVRSGFGSYSFVLCVEEEGRVKYRLMLHTSPSDQIAGIRIKCEYQAFRYGRDLDAVHTEIMRLIDALGFVVEYERLSRVDFNLTVNHSIDFLSQAYDEERICTRISEASIRGRKRFTSYRIGNINTIELAVYDKVKELTDRYDADKIDDLEKALGYSGSDEWTRYEYRLGRRFLHNVGIDTVDDFIQNELALINYLTFDWFMVKKNKSRSGKKINYKVADFWQIVRCSFLLATLTGSHMIGLDKGDKLGALNKHYRTLFNDVRRVLPSITRVPKRRFRKKIKNILKVSVGCMVSAIALSCPASHMMTKADFSKSLVKTASFCSDEAYDKYVRIFKELDGVERDVSNYYVDKPSLMGYGGTKNA